jgi:hypothetical protein
MAVKVPVCQLRNLSEIHRAFFVPGILLPYAVLIDSAKGASLGIYGALLRYNFQVWICRHSSLQRLIPRAWR